jgi:hypothetical protein
MEHVVERSEGQSLVGSVEELVSEIHRYLEAVAVFRELGHEPSWRPEPFASELLVRLRPWLEPCEPRMSAA